MTTPDNRNGLQGSRSPFLQHGAGQPVRWLPWGESAFERARQLDRPILLDIGAVWCHWCHVMDRESYEDEQTAELINELFVPVKVDRDERPDVDARYQRAVQTLTGQGGWPLTAFLTPDGDTFYGGTYFPPNDLYGRPSFRRVLGEVARVWREDRDRAMDAVRGIGERMVAFAQAEVQPGALDPQHITDTVEAFAQSFDFRFGGFGRAPKFPNAGGLQLLLDHDLDTPQDWSRRMVVETLEAMALGGIYDQLGGGFHRYSVDARWLIPHFEKMAYDNGPLLEVCARAAVAYDNETLAQAAHGVVGYYFDVAGAVLERGGFPASQDADYSAHDDGDYWTWTIDELRTVLHAEERVNTAVVRYGLEDPASAMHIDPARHVLYQAFDPAGLAQKMQLAPDQLAERLRSIHTEMKNARDQRPRPFVDETIYSGWTGLVASGFLAAARHLNNRAAGAAALRALERVWQEAFAAGQGLTHRLGDREAGEYLDDHAHFAQALLDAFEYDQQRAQLERASALAQFVEENFRHESGAYTDRPVRAAAATTGLAQPTMSVADAPVPSGNATMALVLLRLSALLGDPALHDRAQRVLCAFAGSAPRLGTAAATYVRALAWATLPVTTVAIVGKDTAQSDSLLQAALRVYRPRTIVRWLRAGQDSTHELPTELQAMVTADAPRAYVCIGQACLTPLTQPEQLITVLRGGNSS
ncbi:MAG: thioredoxin domain-containing protein [Longimicrobiales bacterium]